MASDGLVDRVIEERLEDQARVRAVCQARAFFEEHHSLGQDSEHLDTGKYDVLVETECMLEQCGRRVIGIGIGEL